MRRINQYVGLRQRARAAMGDGTMIAMILVGRDGTGGVGTESVFHAATQLASTYDAEVVVVDLASAPEIGPLNGHGDVPERGERVASIEDQDGDDRQGRHRSASRSAEDVYDRTISQVSGWFFSPPYG